VEGERKLDGTAPPHCASKPGMDDIEREAIRDEGRDPDDPAVVAVLDRVRAALAAVLRSQY
jgi:hypothetical protein